MENDYKWYAKYVAELASSALVDQAIEAPSRFTTYDSPASGRVVIADADIAPIFLAAVTLSISIFIPLLLARFPRVVAILWCYLRRVRPGDDGAAEAASAKAHGAQGQTPDAYGSAVAFVHNLKRSRGYTALTYLAFSLFCLAAAALGPLVALLVSREVDNGFQGRQSGACMAQMNFSDGAENLESTVYTDNAVVEDPVSQVVYEKLDGCLLEDEALCDERFPQTHKVSVDLSPARLGLWYDPSWSLSMEGYCLRLNSTSIWSRRRRASSYQYALHFAPGAVRFAEPLSDICPYATDAAETWYLGQRDRQRFNRRKSVVTDSYFVNADNDTTYPCYTWPNSVRALNADSITILTVLPPREEINQKNGDELYLTPLPDDQFEYTPDQVAHIMCWEHLSVKTASGTFKTSATWNNRSELIAAHNLPTGLNPLLHMANTEFVVKPVRYLRGSSSLLQSIGETPRWEFDPTNAPPVPFAAEVHRWAHIGAMDIASKSTRATTGFYARGNTTALELARGEAAAAQSNPELAELCDMVRTVKEGAVSMPVGVLVALAVLVGVSVVWWLVERLGVILASAGVYGPAGIFRAFLIMPAATPVSLAVAAETAILRARGAGVVGDKPPSATASGHPQVDYSSHNVEPGPSLEQTERGWVLTWGLARLSAAGARKVKIL
ncbi:unnamed protein product [Parascedosporium putredinis]|uniref:Uncharacterized protein n=1 Tax=Parascedosporium putredinis TaxID=1442378 RepID=A0A9P1H480_9PEZI|nr:unnamed protein product [Parascedosporium putredinis]CAI7996373.1 unnamed protein product [Parascedosporium putredinis]